MEQGLGFAHFVTQTDAFGKTVLVLLLLLSIASWYLILTRAVSNWLDRRRAEAYQARSRAARHLSSSPSNPRTTTSPSCNTPAARRVFPRAPC